MDEYSRILLEKEENTKIDENRNKSPPDDFDVWKGVVTSNKVSWWFLDVNFALPIFMLPTVLVDTFFSSKLNFSVSTMITIIFISQIGDTNSKKKNDDLTKKMEEERVVAKAQREVDLLELQKTLDD
nr:hypothetical protein [Tanacetum cinerariifolium]